MSRFEKHALISGILLLVGGAVGSLVGEGPGGPARVLGTLGLGALGLSALSHGARLYRANMAGSLPRSVGRVRVRIRARRLSTMTTTVFALVLPAAAAVFLVALVEWGWLAVAGVALLGCLGASLNAARDTPGEPSAADAAARPSVLLQRLCMRADIAVPQLSIQPSLVANAWTTRGRIHLTTPLVMLLDESELEAVLAHELAHLAHGDAAVMDVCAAPSRILLGFARVVGGGFRAWMRHLFDFPFPGAAALASFFAALALPPALLFGWVSRLSVLRMSRTREFAADAAASTLTGRPSALASALMKLDRESGLLARGDLREVQVLCILGTRRSRLGPLFCTHPPTAARVKRLRAIEERVQAGGGKVGRRG